MSPDSIDPLAWPVERLGEALEALARRTGIATRQPEIANPGAEVVADADALGRWVESAADWLGCEAEPERPSRARLGALLAGDSPVLLRLPGPAPRFLAMLSGGRERVRLLAPDYSERGVAAGSVADAVMESLETRLGEPLLRILEAAGVPPERRRKACERIVRERVGALPVAETWLLRLAPSASFWRHARGAGLGGRVAALAALQALHYALWLLSWWLVGRGALEGRIDRGWLIAWLLLLFTLIPLRLLATWWQGRIAISAGGLLRQRLLHGALRIDADAMRRRGSGQLLGTVIESEAVETLALGGGFLGLEALVELVLATAVLVLGAGGWPHAGLLVLWVGLSLWVGAGYLSRRRRWTELRIGMTHHLVERMVGHRTVVAQEGASRWIDEHDRELDHYLQRSERVDRSMTLLLALLSRGWLLVGLAGVAPAFLAGGASLGGLAVALGGVVLASRSLRKLSLSLAQLTGAAIAWREVAELFEAAGRPGLVGSPRSADRARPAPAPGRGSPPALEASELVFRYPGRDDAVLSGCTLSLAAGERVLLEGPSGGGKSTLAHVLEGLRSPHAGLLLLDGLDLRTLGERGWRRCIAGAPQFHENHIVGDTLAFNLLMGRRWPPREEDMADAESLCRRLGLGPLLDRMPAGLLQQVGETGWQLSHGERSRLFVARALLQQPEILVLDESFGALDPETLSRAVSCVLDRADTLVLIAHP